MGGCLKVTGSPLACFHCCAAIPKGVEISELRDNTAICFCCHGCRGAYLLITGASLHDYYLRREQSQLDFRQDAFQNEYNDSQLARHVYSRNGSSAIDIIISGIRCASCVWLNEKIISRLPGVLEARVNYATNRARVSFNPDTITPAAIFSRISQLGYQPRPYSSSAADDHTQREKNDLLIRFGTAFFLTMQLMAYSFALYAGFFQGIGPEMKHFLQIFSLLVTTPVVFYSGWPFLRGAWRGLRNRAPNMELLIAIGAVSAYLYSIMATFSNGEAYYESAAMIVTLILAGRLLENFARQRAAGGLERLLRLTTGEAKRLNGDMVETIDIEDIAAGDMILVASGERIPVDGRISEGSSDIDESPVTGEPLPVVKSAGDQLLAGCINLTGTIRMICKKTVADSFVSRVAHLVEEAQSRRAPIQGIADRTVAWFVPAVLALALATFLWRFYMSGSPEMALMTTLAVVLIACPCALGLATPTAIVAGTGAAAAAGIIFKGGDILERLSRITVVLFDKTGTITHGRPKVLEVQTLDGISAREALALAAAVESGSLHPIGRSICEYASSLSIPFRTGTELRTVAGGGVIGEVDGGTLAVGSLRFLSELNIVGIPLLIEPLPGATVVYLAHRGCHIGA
ncbi:MAG: heavy metal translocating P-type ATPase metal-binding domain-containing protein, partial [Deltaproteobacteria bacterium]